MKGSMKGSPYGSDKKGSAKKGDYQYQYQYDGLKSNLFSTSKQGSNVDNKGSAKGS